MTIDTSYSFVTQEEALAHFIKNPPMPAPSPLPNRTVTFYLTWVGGGLGILSFYWHLGQLLRHLSFASGLDIWPLQELPSRFWLKAAMRTGLLLGVATASGLLNRERTLSDIVQQLQEEK
ncbi:MAG: hypothetical protein AB7F31_02750 [Parachlamydiales bacterium]